MDQKQLIGGIKGALSPAMVRAGYVQVENGKRLEPVWDIQVQIFFLLSLSPYFFGCNLFVTCSWIWISTGGTPTFPGGPELSYPSLIGYLTSIRSTFIQLAPMIPLVFYSICTQFCLLGLFLDGERAVVLNPAVINASPLAWNANGTANFYVTIGNNAYPTNKIRHKNNEL